MRAIFRSYMVRRSAPKEVQDRLWQEPPSHSGNVSKAASYLQPKGLRGQEHEVKNLLKL